MKHAAQIIARLPADDCTLQAGLVKCDLRQRVVTAQQLRDAVASGHYQTATVEIDGAQLALWYSQLNDGTLWVHFSLAVKGVLGDNLYIAGEHVARELNAPALIFVTKRPAHVDSAIKNGYDNCGLMLAKNF